MKPHHLILTLVPLVLSNSLEADAASPGRLAPQGIYYLTESLVIRLNTGIIRTYPGTKVVCIRYRTGGMEVKLEDGTNVFVRRNQVTNNLDTAARLLADEIARQDKADAMLRASVSAFAASEAKRQQHAEAASREFRRKYPWALQSSYYVPTIHPSNLTGTALDERSGTVAVVHSRKKTKRKK